LDARQECFLIEQNLLPFNFEIYKAQTYSETAYAIKTMIVRGAGAIGAAAGYAMAQAFLQAPENDLLNFVSKAKSVNRSYKAHSPKFVLCNGTGF